MKFTSLLNGFDLSFRDGAAVLKTLPPERVHGTEVLGDTPPGRLGGLQF